MQIYIQNPCHPEISLVLITLCPRNIILVYLACEKLPYYIIIFTSAASERNFSLAGYVVSARRSSIKGANVNNILLIHSSLKK